MVRLQVARQGHCRLRRESAQKVFFLSEAAAMVWDVIEGAAELRCEAVLMAFLCDKLVVILQQVL